jgi:hypothetical protein
MLSSDLTVITGAGFAQGLGGLSVADIDSAFELLPRRDYNVLESQWQLPHRRAFDSLLQKLRIRYRESYNFELLLSALRDMLPFRHHPFIAYTSTLTSVSALDGFDAELMLDVHEVVINELLRLVEGRAIPADGTEFTAACAYLLSLTDVFQIVLCDLNYDDFCDSVYREGVADDGFRGNGWPRTFDSGQFVRTRSRVQLMHLHGSYRFRYNELSGFVKLEHGASRNTPTSADTTDGSRYQSLISGTAKATQLMALPFVVYYHTFGHSILSRPRLLVIGYGGSDLHLNTLLVQMKQIHGPELRVVWVFQGELGQQNAYMRQMCAAFTGERYRDPGLAHLESLPFTGDFAQSGSLLMYNGGFPYARESDSDRIIAHLAS